jgi:hypothetical protein
VHDAAVVLPGREELVEVEAPARVWWIAEVRLYLGGPCPRVP